MWARALPFLLASLWLVGLSPDAWAGDPALSLTSEQKAWALATSAMLFQRNMESHELLAGAPHTDWHIEQKRELLKEWWGVQTRDDLLSTLRWLEQSGHRAEFESLGKIIDRLPSWLVDCLAARVLPAELRHRVAVIRQHRQRLGERSLLGWDFSRYVALCRWGYAASFLTEDEAWRCIMPAARLLQAHFSSWDDLGENYLIGREFWSERETRQSGDLYRATYRTLVSYSGSPWKRCSWSLSLESTPASRL